MDFSSVFEDILLSENEDLLLIFTQFHSMFIFLFAGSDSWTEQTLLLHHHQLQEKRAGAKGLKKPFYII